MNPGVSSCVIVRVRVAVNRTWAGVTPQNVIIVPKCNTNAKCTNNRRKCNTSAKCNNINAKCNKVTNAKCNNFPTQNVITFLTQNVITQIVITPELQVCLAWFIFFNNLRPSEQHTAAADLVNFFIISYRFRLNIQTSSGSLNKILLEPIL